MFKLMALLTADTVSTVSGAGQGGNGGGLVGMLMTFGPMILLFVVFYFFLIRPQQKKEKEVQKMRQSLEVGDEVITIGGIIGRVVSLKEDNVVLETGSDRSKIRIVRSAIQTNNTVHDTQE